MPSDLAYNNAPVRNGKYPNPHDGRSMDRLVLAHQWSRLELEPFRRKRVEAVKQYTGKHYGDVGSSKIVPLPFLKLAISIYLRHLVPYSPRFLMIPKTPQLLAPAMAMEAWGNERIKRMRLEETLRFVAMDAMFLMGIAKVGLCCTGHSVEIEGQLHDYGQPFIDPIDFDDWVHDVAPKRKSHWAYCGHRVRLPLTLVKGNESYDPETRKMMTSGYFQVVNEVGDMRIDMVSKKTAGMTQDAEDYCEVWELYLPRDQLIVTLPAQPGGRPEPRPLSVKEWVGHDRGPYQFLSFAPVPGNAMPSAPVHDLLDLHQLSNLLFRKLGDQASRQKRNPIVPGKARDDIDIWSKAADGQAIHQDFPGEIKEFSSGGYDQNNLLFVQNIKSLYDWAGGNISTLGGLASQADTLGQERLLSQNSSGLVQSMQQDMTTFMHDVLEPLTWYWWTDPLQTYHAQVPVPGAAGMKLPISITPEMRSVDIESLGFELDPYSLVYQTPTQRFNALAQFMTQFLIPAAPVMAQQGKAINWNVFVDKAKKYLNMPDLDELLMFDQNLLMQAQQGGGGGQGMPKPQTSERTYNRVSQGSGSQDAQNNMMMQSLMSGAARNGQA